MKPVTILAATALAALAACTPNTPASNASSAASAAGPAAASSAANAPSAQAGRWEGTVLAGDKTAGDILLKVNTTTGASWVYCCGATGLQQIADSTPVPPGDYHLLSWVYANPDGSTNWNVYRIDNATGKVWIISSQSPFQWNVQN
ncbi:MAG TPA: hypothetical protein VKT30_19220 [Caulobacteraceae bacterium]|nr:hypothetical protein [Caulobacteraceae bacterium]